MNCVSQSNLFCQPDCYFTKLVAGSEMSLFKWDTRSWSTNYGRYFSIAKTGSLPTNLWTLQFTCFIEVHYQIWSRSRSKVCKTNKTLSMIIGHHGSLAAHLHFTAAAWVQSLDDLESLMYLEVVVAYTPCLLSIPIIHNRNALGPFLFAESWKLRPTS